MFDGVNLQPIDPMIRKYTSRKRKIRLINSQEIPLPDQRSELLYWREALEGPSCAHGLLLLPEPGPLPFGDKQIIKLSQEFVSISTIDLR